MALYPHNNIASRHANASILHLPFTTHKRSALQLRSRRQNQMITSLSVTAREIAITNTSATPLQRSPLILSRQLEPLLQMDAGNQRRRETGNDFDVSIDQE
jgi:hypothetical protein